MSDPVDRDAPDHWFEPLADHLGAAYLRYSFTRGTANEVAFLVDELGLAPGCDGRGRIRHRAPGRRALAERGIEVVGVDISTRFIELAAADAPASATFRRLDARHLPFEAEFDAVISLCQGAFGLVGTDGPPADPGPAGPGSTGVLDPDGLVLAGMARALRPAGRLALSAFSSYFQVRFLEETDSFDADRGVNHERTVLRSEAGVDTEADLWTSCFTPRELRLMAHGAGLTVDAVWSVTPGAYRRSAPDLDHPEFLLVAHRP